MPLYHTLLHAITFALCVLPCLSSPITSLSKAGPIYFASQYFFLFLVGAHKRLLKECTNYGIVENGQALE